MPREKPQKQRVSTEAYLAQLKEELPAPKFAAVTSLLRGYKRDGDVHPLIDGVVGALRAREHQHLLRGFVAFLRPADRPWLGQCIRCALTRPLHAGARCCSPPKKME